MQVKRAAISAGIQAAKPPQPALAAGDFAAGLFLPCGEAAGADAMRANRDTRVLPFERRVVELHLNRRDSVMTNSKRLAAIGGGGTNCSAPIELLTAQKAHADLVVIVSDNESWMDIRRSGTGLMQAWERYKAVNAQAKLVCIDIQPNTTTQAVDRRDILNIGGFSDTVFEAVANFAEGKLGPSHWVGEIEKIAL
jgi:60 kDa SS-A/Ro ribonucleoprotein